MSQLPSLCVDNLLFLISRLSTNSLVTAVVNQYYNIQNEHPKGPYITHAFYTWWGNYRFILIRGNKRSNRLILYTENPWQHPGLGWSWVLNTSQGCKFLS